MYPKDTILTTGGAGYIGSHVVVELLNSGYSVIAIDNLLNCVSKSENTLPESLKRVQDITGKKIIFYNVNICDLPSLDGVFKSHKIDCVIHLAALKSVGQSVETPLSYYRNNIIGATTLFQVMQDNNVTRLIFSSSSTVYGTTQFLPVTEDHPTGVGCTNPYGRSKFFVEEILKDICSSDPEWKVISLRYFNPVGAHKSGLIGESPVGVPRSIVPSICKVAVGITEKVLVFGSDYATPDGTAIRDYTHMSDVAIGHLRALEKIVEPLFTGWQAYNMGGGNKQSVLDLISVFSKVCGKEIKYEIVGRRKGDVGECYSDPTKAQIELNWTATRDIVEMCHDAWKWQTKNPRGYQQT